MEIQTGDLGGHEVWSSRPIKLAVYHQSRILSTEPICRRDVNTAITNILRTLAHFALW
jgi:hypothetical protein